MKLLSRASREVRPWKNACGVSEDIIVAPTVDASGDPSWRVALATVDRDVPFSSFRGMDRILMPISGAGMELAVDGEFKRLPRYSILSFRGEASVAARNVRTPAQDINVMIDRSAGAAAMARRYVVGSTPLRRAADGQVTVIVALAPTLRHNGKPLRIGDALLLDDTDGGYLTGFGETALVRITLAR
ncbi:HutD/Ves family protein [Leifsonia shinshuensis]|uniref:Environmental stress-induced protein Ves n=1 Tax=Leifsonia shinshuensis TaxID=150026 RepID=A0A853D544_9MICO|nr:HutD family protein [Leifsonia shinshuensis]NYJ25755.1 environmental stress-induced protein Ves [Leifsonia shinshuensis]